MTCSGTITTVYDWVPATIPNPAPNAPPNSTIPDPLDTPPETVVLKETCEAKFATTGFPSTGAGSCDNGLGFPAVLETIPLYDPSLTVIIGYRSTGLSKGTRYKTMIGGSTITVTCTPSASANVAGTNSSATCTVYYESSVLAPQIVYTGTTRTDTGYQFLTGQQIKCTVDSQGLVVKSGTYAWGEGANSQFKNYDTSAASNQFKGFAKNDHRVAAFSFYTYLGETFAPSCVVQFELPSGTTFDFPASEENKVGGTVSSMRIKGRPLTSVLPTGSFIIKSGTVNPDPPTTYFGLYIPGNPDKPGQEWTIGHIDVPAPFVGQGNGCFVQLINAKRNWKRNPIGSEDASYINKTYGQVALDVNFPYPFNSGGNQVWSVTTDGTGKDFPSQNLSLPESGSTDWWHSSADDSFGTWMMFRPPAVGNQGTVWIPIAKYEWAWGATATKGANNVWTLSGKVAPSVTASHSETDFPQWVSVSGYPIQYKAGTPPN